MVKKSKLNQYGDTIVEVMLALAVTVSVLTGAYVLANKALKIGRLAEERTEATKYAQGQVEAISALAREGVLENAGIPADTPASPPVCLTVWDLPTWDKKAHNSLTCQRNRLYDITVVRETAPAGGYRYVPSGVPGGPLPYGGQYLITVTWPGLGDDAVTQQLEIHYRAYEGI